MKPIRVTVKLQNNLLRARREELQLGCQKLAKKAKISYGLYLNLENMRTSPLRKKVKDGKDAWKVSALKLAKFHRMLPEQLFPSVILAVERSVAEREFDEAEIEALLPAYMKREALGPEEGMMEKQLQETVADTLKLLRPIEAEIVRSRYGLDGAEQKKTASSWGKSTTDLAHGSIR